MWLRNGNGGDGEEAGWVMLFMKCSECVPDVKMYKKRSHTIL